MSILDKITRTRFAWLPTTVYHRTDREGKWLGPRAYFAWLEYVVWERVAFPVFAEHAPNGWAAYKDNQP